MQWDKQVEEVTRRKERLKEAVAQAVEGSVEREQLERQLEQSRCDLEVLIARKVVPGRLSREAQERRYGEGMEGRF